MEGTRLSTGLGPRMQPRCKFIPASPGQGEAAAGFSPYNDQRQEGGRTLIWVCLDNKKTQNGHKGSTVQVHPSRAGTAQQVLSKNIASGGVPSACVVVPVARRNGASMGHSATITKELLRRDVK